MTFTNVSQTFIRRSLDWWYKKTEEEEAVSQWISSFRSLDSVDGPALPGLVGSVMCFWHTVPPGWVGSEESPWCSHPPACWQPDRHSSSQTPLWDSHYLTDMVYKRRLEFTIDTSVLFSWCVACVRVCACTPSASHLHAGTARLQRPEWRGRTDSPQWLA